MSRWFLAALAISGAIGFAPGHVRAQGPFPEELVRWEPAAANPLFEGAGPGHWDAKIRERGWIRFDEGLGRYRLWYTGYADDRDGGDKHLGHATSTDGIRWERDPRNPIHDAGWVEDMCVLVEDGTYLMFAEGRGDVAHMLTSSDGIDWRERGPLDVRLVDGSPIPPGPYGTPTVLKRGDTWHLFYERSDRGVWLATSDDLEVWINVRDDPVIAMGPEPYDRTAVALNQVIERDGAFYGIYHANAHRPWRDWTTCIARSTDLIHWEKYPGNPIVADNCSSGILVRGPDGDALYTMHPAIRRFEYPQEPPDGGDPN